jgi:hypothetical protein
VTIFDFTGETRFYAQCIEQLVLAAPAGTIAELGSGSGDAVITALQSGYEGSVIGVEIDQESAKRAQASISAAGLGEHYEVRLGDFRAQPPQADCLIANPPYMPSYSAEMGVEDDPATLRLLNQCDGGPTGAELSQELLRLDYAQVMLILSTHANPLAILQTAREHEYSVMGWLCRPVTFGRLHVPVLSIIRGLERTGKAFVLPESGTYLIFGVLWVKTGRLKASDFDRALTQCIIGLGSTDEGLAGRS